MTRSGTVHTALLALVVFAIGACSSAQTPGPANGTPQATAGSPASVGAGASVDSGVPKPDPCSIVTADEFKAQLGFAVGPGQLDPFSTAGGLALPARAYCTWYPSDKTIGNSVTIVINYLTANVKAGFESDRTQPGASPAAGIGDAAFLIIAQPGNNSTLHFTKGGWYVELNFGGSIWQVTEAQLTGIAKIVASRLP